MRGKGVQKENGRMEWERRVRVREMGFGKGTEQKKEEWKEEREKKKGVIGKGLKGIKGGDRGKGGKRGREERLKVWKQFLIFT